MSARINLVGVRFGRWTVIRLHNDKYRGSFFHWFCECDCGTIRPVLGADLRRGKSTNCGCLKTEKLSARSTVHGHARKARESKAYQAWKHMRQRCGNPKSKDYPYYGGRGIRICDSWRISFLAFLADMGEPAEGLTIDRIDNDGDYEPGNCRWATRYEQTHNRGRAAAALIAVAGMMREGK